MIYMSAPITVLNIKMLHCVQHDSAGICSALKCKPAYQNNQTVMMSFSLAATRSSTFLVKASVSFCTSCSYSF